MSLYRFVRGGRLFVEATREGGDRDDVAAGGGAGADGRCEELSAVETRRRLRSEVTGRTESVEREARRHGVRRVTTRVLRRTTTLSRAEELSSAERSLLSRAAPAAARAPPLHAAPHFAVTRPHKVHRVLQHRRSTYSLVRQMQLSSSYIRTEIVLHRKLGRSFARSWGGLSPGAGEVFRQELGRSFARSWGGLLPGAGEVSL
ncbi:uncharacterized protein LOC126279007 [Schistocerca gregaria]|uniref:uncharacterized protein LOC126279007 n=1 Tax=Schistocerca gregaria TaxID=7010 RepID=UPI00211EC2B8|nr:uncharacterized protein LOC126279007 [Schistocerca gregaria]